MQAKFANVKGYSTYERAQKRGEQLETQMGDVEFRWVVISLPSGRFTPCVIANVNTSPGWFISQPNICIVN